MRRKLLLYLSALLALILLLALLHRSPTRPGEQPVDTRLRLNSFIDNARSDCPRLDKAVERFMRRWDLAGVQLAVMRGDSLLYAKGYGKADEDVPMQPYMTMRVASVSKLITAAAVMKLTEQGRLSLEDKVLGPEGILNDTAWTAVIRDKRHFRITVEHLLRHQAGFTLRLGDPLFNSLDFAAMNGLQEPPTEDRLCRIVLHRRLGFTPGTSQSYSNFGYLLLSLVIEKVSGMRYEDYVRSQLIEPAGCYDFHIAGNFYSQKKPSEVRYYMHGNTEEVPCYDLSGRMVERCYGGNNITALKGAGAWCCSVPELMRLVASIDGRPGVPDVLSEASVAEMVRYVDKHTFSLGWNDTDPKIGWMRSGSFSGTAALVKYFPDGECWIFVTNSSTYRGHHFTRRIAQFFSECRRNFGGELPSQDLFRPSEE